MPLAPLYPRRTPLSPLWSPEPQPSSHRWADSLSQWPHPQEQREGTLPELSTACGRLHQTGMSQQHRRCLLAHPGHHRWENAAAVGLWWCSELALLAKNLLNMLIMLTVGGTVTAPILQMWKLRHIDVKSLCLASNRAQKWPNKVHALNHSLPKQLFLLLRQSLSIQNFLLAPRI